MEVFLATNEHGNGNVFPFCHRLKLAMETEMRFHFQPTTDQLSFVCVKCVLALFMARLFKVAITSNGTIVYSLGASFLSLIIAGTIILVPLSWIISRMTRIQCPIRLGVRILYFDTLMLTLVVQDQCQQ
jgi:hypothetical protein